MSPRSACYGAAHWTDVSGNKEDGGIHTDGLASLVDPSSPSRQIPCVVHICAEVAGMVGTLQIDTDLGHAFGGNWTFRMNSLNNLSL